MYTIPKKKADTKQIKQAEKRPCIPPHSTLVRTDKFGLCAWSESHICDVDRRCYSFAQYNKTFATYDIWNI